MIGEVAVTLVTEPPAVGMSAATRARKVGCAAPPEVGPAHTVLADSFALVIASVPEPVTGEPETLNSTGTVCPTEVTLPTPDPLETAVSVRWKMSVSGPCVVAAGATRTTHLAMVSLGTVRSPASVVEPSPAVRVATKVVVTLAT